VRRSPPQGGLVARPLCSADTATHVPSILSLSIRLVPLEGHQSPSSGLGIRGESRRALAVFVRVKIDRQSVGLQRINAGDSLPSHHEINRLGLLRRVQEEGACLFSVLLLHLHRVALEHQADDFGWPLCTILVQGNGEPCALDSPHVLLGWARASRNPCYCILLWTNGCSFFTPLTE